MAIQPVPNYTPAPTPPIQRGDRATFSDRVDDTITYLQVAPGEVKAMADVTFNNASEAVAAASTAVGAAGTAVSSATQALSTVPVTSLTPPPSPAPNAVWIHENTAREYTYLATANGFRWVETAASVVYQSPTSAEDQSFTAGGTGAVARSTRDKLRETVSISDFAGADPTGVADSLAAFNAAAAVGKTVTVPKGNWKLSAPTTGNAVWTLEAGAYISGLPNVSPGAGGGMNDTKRLTGRISHAAGLNGGNGFRLGDTDPWLERDIRYATEIISEVSILSSTGQIALTTGSRSSDNPTANYAAIGHSSYGINDNVTNPEPAWAQYLEARRQPGAGPAFDTEMDMVNRGNTFDFDPYSSFTAATGQTVNLWITNGGGDVAHGGLPASAAFVLNPNPSTWRRGIVVRNGALDGVTNEVMAMPQEYKAAAWYSSAGVRRGFMDGYTLHQTKLSDVGTDCVSHKYYRRKANGTTATAPLDLVWRSEYYGWDGTAAYSGAYAQVIQRGPFNGGHARFSYDITAHNGLEATDSQVSLNGMANKSFAPSPDNSLALGDGSFRWTVVYAVTGTISTSDETQKQDVVGIDDALIDAFLSVEPVTYRWKDAVAGKGDAARIHAGWIAQHLQAALIAQGLDPARYAIWCEDDVYAPVPGWDGKGVPDVQPTGEKRQALRYDQFIALMEAANRRRFEQFESRLRALEAAFLTGGK